MGVINLSILVEKIKRKLIGSGFVTNTDYASADKGGVVKISSTYGLTISPTYGIVQGSGKTLEQYNSGAASLIVAKGTLENTKADVTARALVDIAAAQIATPVTGTYTVKLTYDGAAWGVTIIPDT